MFIKRHTNHFRPLLPLLIAFQFSIGQSIISTLTHVNGSEIMRAHIMTDALLPCTVFEADKFPVMTSFYHCGAERKKIGFFTSDGEVTTEWSRNGAYEIRQHNGTPKLLIKSARRELVDRYECVVMYDSGETFSSSIYFRLDFSFWYDQRWDSLFYGSLLASLVFCAASFVLNVIWIGCRKTVLWWINRTERMSRVRSMVEAMEKYRQKQMENLHDTYHRKVTAIRENYHQQVEQLRVSYGNQVGRFRGYRQAQMEHVTQHLDNIRENYNQQLSRIREYGARRTERLWENYERQLNRMRMFTLEQRLRLMRQYKVKQRYINKLLETLADNSNPDYIQKRESEIRAALNLPIDTSTAFPHADISRAASYYSLPEFVIEDDLPHSHQKAYHKQQFFAPADVPSTSRDATLEHQFHFSTSTSNPHPHSFNLATVRSPNSRKSSRADDSDDGECFMGSHSEGVVRRASRSLYASMAGVRHRGDSEHAESYCMQEENGTTFLDPPHKALSNTQYSTALERCNADGTKNLIRSLELDECKRIDDGPYHDQNRKYESDDEEAEKERLIDRKSP